MLCSVSGPHVLSKVKTKKKVGVTAACVSRLALHWFPARVAAAATVAEAATQSPQQLWRRRHEEEKAEQPI